MRHRAVLTLAFLALPLAAQDITGGLYTGLSLPGGDLKDKSGWGTNQFFGVHVGGHLEFPIAPRQEIRAHLTYQSFPGSGWGGFENAQNDFKILQAGADWVYRFRSPNLGWYALAGASLNSVKNDWEYTDGAGIRRGGSYSQSGKLGARGGAGYIFNRNFSVEGTLNQVFVDKHGGDGFNFDTATWLQASAVFRFGR
ncbi:outer membrane beta-barrel protein [Geothrix sp. 21YS21S-4]|uniref:outer membrane beta-barrel protein n=1 Tax=Geothrix sp. 21YS21S-4 TaxID=3068889 RepID=UPI0027B9EF63|nr:outer membrane beta-barrel protein [Geothrix sp. 21YS21S-4]